MTPWRAVRVLDLAGVLYAQGEDGLAILVDLRVEHLVLEVCGGLRLEVQVRAGGLEDQVVLAGPGRCRDL
jgi:hypothetical protein